MHIVGMHAYAVNATGKYGACVRVEGALEREEGRPAFNQLCSRYAGHQADLEGRKLGRDIRCPFRAIQGPKVP